MTLNFDLKIFTHNQLQIKTPLPFLEKALESEKLIKLK